MIRVWAAPLALAACTVAGLSGALLVDNGWADILGAAALGLPVLVTAVCLLR